MRHNYISVGRSKKSTSCKESQNQSKIKNNYLLKAVAPQLDCLILPSPHLSHLFENYIDK
jgi:hypothetical protein